MTDIVKMYGIAFLLCLIVKSDQMKKEENFTGFFDFMNGIQQGDWIGRGIDIVDSVLSNSFKNVPPPNSDLCIPKLVKFGENEMKFSIQPRGFCTYCCRLHKPSRYIRLYFSNKSKPEPIEIATIKGTLRNVGVKPNLPTVFFIHGFGEYALGPSPKQILNAYLSLKEDYNVFLVDWGDLSAFPWYPQAKAHTRIVGNVLGKFIGFFSDSGELSIANTHVVGFSLGAHISGFAGQYLIKHGYQKLPRITGLDPASPGFVNEEGISTNDADFVDVIHTDAGKFGIGYSVGHVDFYPNGGSFIQPGCQIGSLADQKLIDQFAYCSHIRAWKLYAESVRNSKAFPSMKMSGMDGRSGKQFQFVPEVFMGLSVDHRIRGDYFLLTNGKAPFSKSPQEQESEMMSKH